MRAGTFETRYTLVDTLLGPIETVIGWLIAQIYSVVPSVGVAIILVTCLVMLLIFPLTHKQTKSMVAMQALQPQLKELQVKYKDDRTKLSEETMALYKTAGVNPLGGCLPTLIQMPFLFSIFRVVSHIEKYVDPNSGMKPSPKLFNALCAPAKTVEVCRGNAGVMQKNFPTLLPDQAEALAAKLPVGKEFLGLNLSKNFVAVSDRGFSTIAAYVILIVLLAVTSYISISRQHKNNPNTPSQMKFLKYLFPVGISISGIILPAGSNLYILTSSTWRAIQQELLFIKVIKPHREKDSAAEKASSGPILEGDNANYAPGLARKKRKKK